VSHIIVKNPILVITAADISDPSDILYQVSAFLPPLLNKVNPISPIKTKRISIVNVDFKIIMFIVYLMNGHKKQKKMIGMQPEKTGMMKMK